MLLSRAIKKVQRFKGRAFKHASQALSASHKEARPLFIVGAQRSGTNMLLNVLDKSLETRTYNEDHPAAFEKYRLKDRQVRDRILRKASCAWGVFKPLCDTQHLDQLLADHQDGKALWILRDYRDVANSASVKWGHAQRHIIQHIAEKDDQWTRWYCERMSPERRSKVRTLYHADMTEHTAAALKWYLRNILFFDLQLQHRSDDVLLLRYENLVQHPASFQQIFDFLEIPYSPSYTRDVFEDAVGKNKAPQIESAVEALCEDLLRQFEAVIPIKVASER